MTQNRRTKTGENIAKPYAEAFYQFTINLCLENPGKLNLFYNLMFDMQDIERILLENKTLQDCLNSPVISDLDKKAILNKCFSGKIDSNVLNFLKLVVDKKRIQYLDTIIQLYLDKVYVFLGVKFVEVWSAVELTTTQKQNLISQLKTILEPVSLYKGYTPPVKVQLRENIDPTILGGLIIKIDSKIIDLSLRGDLAQLGKALSVSL